MNLAAFARAALTLAAGAALAYLLARWLGWWTVAVIVGGATAAAIAELARWPRTWRPW